MSINYWIQNVADMPHKDEKGKWVDLETGLSYQDYKDQQVQKKKLSDEAMNCRKYAKKFGARAIVGTHKQKEWAEKIRYEVLSKLNDEEATFICGHGFSSKARFWINTRAKEPREIFLILHKLRTLSEAFHEANTRNDSDAVHKIADEYNRITGELVF